ncbi:MAG TPA: 3-isopropylmalate dehydratase small subunit [Actinomycetota bacterium]|nr:3-isopropylmalate dehydratase small subunit [Actinomycetota bacterium]
MEPVETITGRAMPLRRSDVDTDQIIPAVWLKNVGRTGFAAGLFSAWREDPEFVLNQPRFKNACILLTGPNFGSGSSREHAVWALAESGFYAVISSRFADIFKANCFKNGMLAVELSPDAVGRLMDAVEADTSVEITLDVKEKRVSCPAAGVEESFELDDFTQWRLLNGLDDISLTLQRGDAISRYEASRPGWRPAIA